MAWRAENRFVIIILPNALSGQFSTMADIARRVPDCVRAVRARRAVGDASGQRTPAIGQQTPDKAGNRARAFQHFESPGPHARWFWRRLSAHALAIVYFFSRYECNLAGRPDQKRSGK